MPESLIRADLHEELARWMAEGLIDTVQGARIEAAEAGRPQPPPSPAPADRPRTARPVTASVPRRTPLAVEALGYLGSGLAIVAGLRVLPVLWPRIPTGAELAIAAIAAIAFAAAGAVLRVGHDPSFTRLRSVLWLMSTVGLSAFMALLAAQIWDLDAVGASLVTASAATVYAAVLWWRARATLQHLALFAAMAAVTGTVITIVGPGLRAWGPGLGIWVLSALWGLAVHRGYLVPRAAGYSAAGIGMLTGAQMTMEIAAGPALALATVAGLLIAGAALNRTLLLGLGSAGVILIVPQSAIRYLPTSIGTPLAVFAVGLILIGVALWLARSRRQPRPG